MTKYSMVIALAVVFVLFYFLTNGRLLYPQNMSNLMLQNGYVLVMACGMLLCILTGGNIDLSVGSVICLVGGVAAVMITNKGMNPILTIVICLLIGLIAGVWQGFWIGYVRIPPFITTLAGMFIFRGIGRLVLDSKTVSVQNKTFLNIFTAYIKIPGLKLGIIAVSRDCFPIALSTQRRENIVKAYGEEIYNCTVTVENELDMLKAVADVKKVGCNALVVFLGNFGPETPETQIAQNFDGPCMFVAAAEGDGDMIDGRGDAYCGMLNCSYNLGMRHLKGYIPEYPVGTAEEVAQMIREFVPVARAIIGISSLKIITFGPRPQDFFACNAPIKGLYELGVEVEENSELDLLVSYKEHADDPRIPAVCEDMVKEMGEGAYYPELSARMAQFELTLLDWAENHKGSKKYVAFADKCWPAFPSQFGFEPCYVNSRLVSRGIPVSCEVDIYGALSEYIGMCVSGDIVTLLDINNSVPKYIYDEDIKGKYACDLTDTFMGFHCGNTPSCKMCASRAVKYQLIQHRLLEPEGSEPDFTRGTLEGDIAASPITFYRLQCDSDGVLRSYIAEGEVLDVPTRSFGGIGIFAIPEMGRFYRHVLIQKRYPHHGAVAFAHVGKALFEVMKYLGVQDIAYNQPKNLPYPTENPFS